MSEPGPDPETGKEASEPEPTRQGGQRGRSGTETAGTGYVQPREREDLDRPIM